MDFPQKANREISLFLGVNIEDFIEDWCLDRGQWTAWIKFDNRFRVIWEDGCFTILYDYYDGFSNFGAEVEACVTSDPEDRSRVVKWLLNTKNEYEETQRLLNDPEISAAIALLREKAPQFLK